MAQSDRLLVGDVAAAAFVAKALPPFEVTSLIGPGAAEDLLPSQGYLQIFGSVYSPPAPQRIITFWPTDLGRELARSSHVTANAEPQTCPEKIPCSRSC